MKCPICGSVNNEGASFCANCGSALKNETSGYMDSIDTSNLNNNNGFGKRNTQSFDQQPQYQQNTAQQTAQNYGNAYQQGAQPQNNAYNTFNQQQFNNNFTPYATTTTVQKKSGGKAVLSVIVAIIVFCVAFGARYYARNYATKTISGTGYTMTAPSSMKKSSNTSVFALDSFQNSEVAINAVKLDYSDLELYGYGAGVKPKELFDFIMANSTNTNMNIVRSDDNYVYYTQSVGGKNYYGMSAIKEGNGGYYVFDFLCEKDNQSKYESKFKKWAESIKIN